MVIKYIKKAPFFSAFILCGVLLCSLLGLWQLKRLVWKNALEAQISENLLGKAQDFSVDFTSSSHPFLRVKLNGTFVETPPVYLVGKYRKKDMGLHALQPYQLETGEHVLINTGWVQDTETPLLQGMQPIEAIIMPSREKPLFLLPSNNTQSNVWLWENMAELHTYYDTKYSLSLTPTLLQRVDNPESDIQPIALKDEISLYNQHLNYALTWFGLALILFGMLAIYLRGKQQ